MLFTIDCQAPARRSRGTRPASWEVGARVIDGFCTLVGAAGQRATVFVTPSCAEEHAPLLEELAGRGVEVGILLDPPEQGGVRRHLGAHTEAGQGEIARASARRFRAALGVDPTSVRSAEFSASDRTFAVLSELGLRQGSLSSPGRHVRGHAAMWTGAERDAHPASASDRLRPGSLDFLEVPVTTDPGHVRGGLAADLCLDGGEFASWHRPLADAQLRRMEEEGTAFPSLCFHARTGRRYDVPGTRARRNLEAALDYVGELGSRRPVAAVTLAQAHRRYTAGREG